MSFAICLRYLRQISQLFFCCEVEENSNFYEMVLVVQ